ncbi:MAG: regulatory protein RecX [Candidatus Omnitrophica bacterium]|nr:regulatory protein RecX [Candidatus Omnitrophota bacterium]
MPEETNDTSMEKARSVALRLLKRRPRSRWELQSSLQGREYSAPVQTQVLDELEKAGLIDDERFARYWTEHRVLERQTALRAIETDLLQKGLDEALVQKTLSRVAADVDERRLASEWVERWRALLSGSETDKDRARWKRRLMQRGFSEEDINAALSFPRKREST